MLRYIRTKQKSWLSMKFWAFLVSVFLFCQNHLWLKCRVHRLAKRLLTKTLQRRLNLMMMFPMKLKSVTFWSSYMLILRKTWGIEARYAIYGRLVKPSDSVFHTREHSCAWKEKIGPRSSGVEAWQHPVRNGCSKWKDHYCITACESLRNFWVWEKMSLSLVPKR